MTQQDAAELERMRKYHELYLSTLRQHAEEGVRVLRVLEEMRAEGGTLARWADRIAEAMKGEPQGPKAQ